MGVPLPKAAGRQRLQGVELRPFGLRVNVAFMPSRQHVAWRRTIEVPTGDFDGDPATTTLE